LDYQDAVAGIRCSIEGTRLDFAKAFCGGCAPGSWPASSEMKQRNRW